MSAVSSLRILGRGLVASLHPLRLRWNTKAKRRFYRLVGAQLHDPESGLKARYFRWNAEGVTFRRWLLGREHFARWEQIVWIDSSYRLVWREGEKLLEAKPPQLGNWFSSRWKNLFVAWTQWRAEKINRDGELRGEFPGEMNSGHLPWMMVATAFILLCTFFFFLGDAHKGVDAGWAVAAINALAAIATGSVAFFLGVSVLDGYRMTVFGKRFRRWRITPHGFASLEGNTELIAWSRVPRRWANYVRGNPSAQSLMRALIDRARPRKRAYTGVKIALGLLACCAGGYLIAGEWGATGALIFASLPLYFIGWFWLFSWRESRRDRVLLDRLSSDWH